MWYVHTTGLRSQVLIDTLDTLDQYFDQYYYLINIPIDTRSTLNWHLIKSGLIVNRQPTVDQDVDEVSIEGQLECRRCL